jgi:hypothetical protein
MVFYSPSDVYGNNEKNKQQQKPTTPVSLLALLDL